MKHAAFWAVLGAAFALAALPPEQKKKEREETQTLELPKEPPNAVVADTTRLVFHNSPLSGKGLLSQQTRDALKDLFRQVKGAAIVHLRGFVAGSGDVRRVQAIVSDTFTDRRLPLPALSVVQVGGLPREGSQLVLESIAVDKKAVNPFGLAFISGQAAIGDQPMSQVAPLVEQSLAHLKVALGAAGLESKDVVRATCYLSSLEGFAAVRQRFAEEFPGTPVNLLQRQRAPVRNLVECEAVARLRAAPVEPVQFLNPPGLTSMPAWSQVALVNVPRLALSGTQLAFGFTEADARLAFQRLGKSLGEVGTSLDQVAVSSIYPLSNSITQLVGRIRPEFFKARSPAGTMLTFEGLPSLDAAFAIDAIAAVPEK